MSDKIPAVSPAPGEAMVVPVAALVALFQAQTEQVRLLTAALERSVTTICDTQVKVATLKSAR